jgi:hypothetical protein
MTEKTRASCIESGAEIADKPKPAAAVRTKRSHLTAGQLVHQPAVLINFVNSF